MRQITKPKGDTLIEVVISLAILATILAIATTAALTFYRTTRAANERSQALYLAQRQAEALRAYAGSLSWSQVTDPTLGGLGVTQYIDCWSTNCYYPTQAGNPTNDPNSKTFKGFYLDLQNDTGPCPNNGSPCHWKLEPGPQKNVTSIFTVVVVPNRANPTPQNLTDPTISDNLLRFDIKVTWTSIMSGPTLQSVSFITYLTNNDL